MITSLYSGVAPDSTFFSGHSQIRTVDFVNSLVDLETITHPSPSKTTPSPARNPSMSLDYLPAKLSRGQGSSLRGKRSCHTGALSCCPRMVSLRCENKNISKLETCWKSEPFFKSSGAHLLHGMQKALPPIMHSEYVGRMCVAAATRWER